MIDYGYAQSELCWGNASPIPISRDTVTAICQGIKAVGGSRVRMGVQVGTWDDLDYAVSAATGAGLKPLLCILGNETLQVGSQSNVVAFGALCKAIALRYGPSGTNQVTEYELYNESNNVFFNPPKVQAAQFVDFLKSGYTAIHSVHTSAIVMPAGTVPTYMVWFGWADDPVQWYTKLYDAGAKDYMDALAMHLYCDLPALPTPDMRQWKYMTDVRDLMVARGDGAKKIWVTEVGTSNPGPGITSAVIERDYLKAMVDGILSYDWMGPFYIYSFENTADQPNDPNASNYGIVSWVNLVPKSPKYEYCLSIAGIPDDPDDIVPPDAPTGLSVTSGGRASWLPAVDDVGVTVYRIKDSVTNAVLASTSQIGQVSVQIPDLTRGASHTVYATALDAAGNESEPSDPAEFTTDAPSGLQQLYSADFSTSGSVPVDFVQLGLGFAVASGVAMPIPPTVDGDYYTAGPYVRDLESPDCYSEISQDASSYRDRYAMAMVRMSADGTQWVAAFISGGVNGQADAAQIITRDGGVVTLRNARNATPLLPGEKLRITALGNVYTAERYIDGVGSEVVAWTDTNGVYSGAANRRTGIGWRHKRVGSVNYAPPGISGWKAADLNAVMAAQTGAVEPWMYAIVDMDDWAELTATGSWETLMSSRELVPAAPGPSVPPVPSSFVTRDAGTGNLMFNGSRYRFGGANAPFMGIIGSAPAAVAGETVLPGDGYHYASHAQIDATLAAAQAFNSNVLTSWGAVQSVGTPSSVQPTLGVFNAAALEATDYCLQQCNLLGIKLIVNFSGNYTYETEGSKFWYCTANGVTPDAYATQFFTNSTIINSLKAHISFCLNHVNVYTGVRYADDPAILAWGTGGEMSTYPAVPEWPYYAWTDAISQHIKVTCGAQQLVADGHCAIRSDQQDGTIDVNSLTLPYVDMYQLHPYSHWTPPRYSTQEGKICHQYGKAYFIGEFPWQGVEPDTSTPTIWSPTELMSVARGSTYVDGIQMWELLAPNVTFGGGYTLHWPTPDNSSGHGIALETARGGQMAANNLAMSTGKVWPTRLVAVRTSGVQYNSAAYRGGGFNAEGITLYIPEENDVVLVFGGSQGVNTVANAPAGWVNPLGANVGVSSASHTLACMYHVVTAAEALAGNVSYVVVNMFNAGANGDGAITVIRGANPASVIDAFGTASGTSSTTHVLPALTGASLQDDSMVLSCVSSFANNAYTVPTGTGEAGVSNGHQGIWLGLYDDFTSAGVNVAAKNITAVNSDVYASITLAITGL